ncbi:DNA excision repair protein ERCC-6-like [Crenichthys baileyi]|uniref:DNA excision repair protein ERCC-6-like n=1 Tax=Crenichthys baileyi TaxID=28760 RepID=A0AAV9RE40_9TELE
MYDNKLIRHTLLVIPASLITNWINEFSKWTGMRVKEFHGTSKSQRTRNLEKVQSIGGMIITTYNMLISNFQQLASYRGKELCWDYMILDEARYAHIWDWDHDEEPKEQEEHHYINGRVQKAQELVKAESQRQMQLAETWPRAQRQPA